MSSLYVATKPSQIPFKFSQNRSNGQQIKVRMGEWNTATPTEPIPYQEFNVIRIFVHPLYNPSTLSNGIAILRLSPNVPLGQHPAITTACLSGNDFQRVLKIF